VDEGRCAPRALDAAGCTLFIAAVPTSDASERDGQPTHLVGFPSARADGSHPPPISVEIVDLEGGGYEPDAMGLAGVVYTSATTVNVPEKALKDPRLNAFIDGVPGSQSASQPAAQPSSVLCVPFATVDGARTLGVCSVFNRRDGLPFGKADEAALRPLLRSAAYAIEGLRARAECERLRQRAATQVA